MLQFVILTYMIGLHINCTPGTTATSSTLCTSLTSPLPEKWSLCDSILKGMISSYILNINMVKINVTPNSISMVHLWIFLSLTTVLYLDFKHFFLTTEVPSTSELADHVAMVLQCFLKNLLSGVHLPTPLGAYRVCVVSAVKTQENRSSEQGLMCRERK